MRVGLWGRSSIFQHYINQNDSEGGRGCGEEGGRGVSKGEHTCHITLAATLLKCT